MHVNCPGEQANFNFVYAFSMYIGTLLLVKCINKDRNIIEQN